VTTASHVPAILRAWPTHAGEPPRTTGHGDGREDHARRHEASLPASLSPKVCLYLNVQRSVMVWRAAVAWLYTQERIEPEDLGCYGAIWLRPENHVCSEFVASWWINKNTDVSSPWRWLKALEHARSATDEVGPFVGVGGWRVSCAVCGMVKWPGGRWVRWAK
jgi:hypothetical protein